MNSKNDSISLSALFDGGAYTELNPGSDNVSVTCGFGKVGGVNAYAYLLNGALDVKGCERIVKAYSFAEKTGCPIISVLNSDGVELNEGYDVFSAYGEIVKYSGRLSGVVPQVAIINGACLGVLAVCANLADVVIAVKDSDFSVTAPTEITVDESFNSGAVDIVAESFEDAIDKACDVVSLLPSNNLSAVPCVEFEGEGDASDNGVISAISDNQITVELKGGYAENVTTALSTVNGKVTGFVCFNGNALCVGCSYKAEAFIKLCDAYNIPVVTIANASGINRENEAQTLIALTKLTSVYANATCPKISVVTEECTGGAYVILAGKGANADLTFAVEGAVVSPMSVDSAVSFLWNDRLAAGEDRSALENEYKSTLGSAKNAAENGAFDDIFSIELLRDKISNAIEMLSGKRESTLARKHTVK